MDRFAKEYLKALRKEQNQNKMIAILVLILLILFMPVLFLLLGGPKKISEMNDSKSHGISGESIASEFNRGVSDIVGTEGTVAVEEQDTRVEDVVRISELQTMEYNYDAICRVEDYGATVYYIAYESTVTLGINTTIRQSCCCDSADNLTIVLITGAGVVNNVSMRVEKS